jgi:hypothetical protein
LFLVAAAVRYCKVCHLAFFMEEQCDGDNLGV